MMMTVIPPAWCVVDDVGDEDDDGCDDVYAG